MSNNITATQFRIIKLLASKSYALNHPAIAEDLDDLAVRQVRRLCNQLHDAGYLRKRNPNRTKNIHWLLTEQGEAIARAEAGTNEADSDSVFDEARVRGIAKEMAEDIIAEERARIAEQIREAIEAMGKAQHVVYEIPHLEITIDPGKIAHPTFGTITRLLAGGNTRIYITGPKGLGKTYAVEQLAAAMDIPLFVGINLQEEHHVFGYTMGEVYVETEIYRWATHDGPAILLLDEVDGNDPSANLALNAMLANGIGVFPTGRVSISDDKIVIATANTWGDGATAEYNARQAQDGAFLDRFDAFPHWELHEPTECAIAKLKVPGTTDATIKRSQAIREALKYYGIDVQWSPRRTFALCRNAACGFAFDEAARLAGLTKLSDSEFSNVMSRVGTHVAA